MGHNHQHCGLGGRVILQIIVTDNPAQTNNPFTCVSSCLCMTLQSSTMMALCLLSCSLAQPLSRSAPSAARQPHSCEGVSSPDLVSEHIVMKT